MASSRESRYTTEEVLAFLSEDKFVSSNESSDEEMDFKEYVGTVAVSDSNLDEESTSTHELVSTEQWTCNSQPHSALVQLDDFSTDVSDTCVDASNSFFNIPPGVGSSMLADSSAVDLWRSSEDSDSSGNEHTSPPEGVTTISTKEDNEVDSSSSDDGADDMDASESDASQVSSTTHGSDPAVSMPGTDTSRPQLRGRGRGRPQSRGRGRGRAQSRGRGHGRGQLRGRGCGRGQARQLLPASAKPISVNDSHFVEGEIFSPAREVGPQFSIDDSLTELNLFCKYFDDAVIEHLVDATNDYAERKKTAKRLMYMRFKSLPLTSEEVWRYLGVLLLLSINSIRSYRQAWNTKSSQV